MARVDDRDPAPTNVSVPETRADPQLSACANEMPADLDLSFRRSTGRSSDDARSDANSAAAHFKLSPGQLLGGRYRIDRELGEGGMGIVYLVTDEQVAGERFAVKVLKEEPHPEALAQLREEVRKTRKLSHPNILDMHSVNVDGSIFYVLMEYLEGKSLDTLLNEEFGRGMSFSHAWPVIEDVAAALGMAHDHNVIHSDLKPANVFLTTSGRTKLLDFGIARVSRGPLLKTDLGAHALTPAYASCDMLDGNEADRRDDIYSFACVIYEMLGGERPYRNSTAVQARAAGMKVAPLEKLSRTQNAALARALAFERESRTGSVEALLAGLELGSKPRGRSKALIGMSAVVAILVMSVGYLAILRLRAPHPGQVVVSNSAILPTTIPQNSIAVLPFVNVGGEKDQEYFSDGLTEEMINLLGRVPDLRVPARTSSFYFKGRSEAIGDIARLLKVANVLEGSVRKAGNRLRITAELIRADNGYHIWSQVYDRDDADIFAVQNDIAKAVVSTLQLKIGAPVQETGSRGTKNTEAYGEYLRGTQLDQRDSLELLRRAVGSYKRATELDPHYAAAYAGLATSEAVLADLTGDSKGIEQAGRDANEAIALAPEDAVGYSARSYLRTVWLWDWSGAQGDIEKALSLGPRTKSVLGRYARLHAVMGRLPDAVAAQRQAAALDPLSSGAWDNLGLYYLSSGDYPAADAALDRAMEIEPGSVFVLTHVGMLRLLQNRGPEALEEFRKIDQEGFRLAGLAMAEHSAGKSRESQQALDELIAKHADEQAYQVAEACAWLGQNDLAFAWLERAYRQRDGGVSQVKFAPMLRSLHGDPRYKSLLRTMKLPE